MKRLKIYLFPVMMVLLFMAACEDTPTFPDPKFDSITDKHLAVRRDTADFFMIKTNMDVPNGIRVVELLDGKTYTLIKSFDEYRGIKKLDFAYKVDVSNYNIDTTFTYIIRVQDQDLRSYNKAFIIDLKKISIPEIFVMGGKNLGVSAPAIGLKALIQTGMVPIREITVKIDNNELFRFEPAAGETVTEYKMNEILYVELEEGKEYDLTVEVCDQKNRTETEVIKAKRVELSRPKRVALSGSFLTGSMDFTYDDHKRISRIMYSNLVYTFNYNTQNLLDTISLEFPIVGIYRKELRKFVYTYNELGQLLRMDRNIFRLKETGEWITVKEETMASDLTYNPDGTMQSLIAGANRMNNICYADGFIKGERLFTEIISKYGLASTTDPYRRRAEGHVPIYMPTYMSEFPYPIVELTESQGYPIMANLLFQKYVPTRWVKYSDGILDTEFSYELDSEGRLSRFVHDWNPLKEPGWARTDIYTFIY